MIYKYKVVNKLNLGEEVKVTIVSISAKNIHKSLAAWCLKSYCNSKGLENIEIYESNINVSINEIVAAIITTEAAVIAFSCYIWNIEYITKIAGIIRKLLSKVTIILGGPEVSFEYDLSSFPFADYIITGAGEQAFYDLIVHLHKSNDNPDFKELNSDITNFKNIKVNCDNKILNKNDFNGNKKEINDSLSNAAKVKTIEINHNISSTKNSLTDSKTDERDNINDDNKNISKYNLSGEIDNRIIKGYISEFSSYPSAFTNDYFNSFIFNQIPAIGSQLIYYESSRGCPFSCSYCLSSATEGIQYLPLDRVQNDILLLIKHGAKCIKFVDRTFNANKHVKDILQFIYELNTDCTFHFEAAADLFNKDLLQIISLMPIGRVQFEIGIQSTNEKTLNAVNRKTNIDAALNNIAKLVCLNNCHIHLDLIAGLPYDNIETFISAINQCINCKPQMLQLGFLKMLKGTKLRRDSNLFGAVYADFPPYEVYKTNSLSCEEISQLKKVEQIIDRFYNSGAFTSTVNFAISKLFSSPYSFFISLCNYCEKAIVSRISLKNAYNLLYNFLLPYGSKQEIEHHIKLDCFSTDKNGLLPDGINSVRNKQAELIFKSKSNKNVNIRIEFFEYENKHKLFNYDKKDVISNRYAAVDLDC